MKLKKVMSVLLAASIALGATACGSSGKASGTKAPDAGNTGAENTAAGSTAEPIEIRMSWWGGDSRNERMNQVLDLYESQHPGITVTREYTGWSDYFIKYSTHASSGTQPDVSPIVMQSIQEYVNKGVLLPLDEYVTSGALDLSDWSNAAVSPGMVNGKLYAVVYAITSQGVVYNTKLLEQAGVEEPKENWTVAEFVAYCKELREKLPKDIWIVEDAAYSDHAIESFMRSKGKTLYAEDGKSLGFDKEDLAEWFSMWDDLRKSGCVPSAAITAEVYGAPYEQTMFGSNKSVMVFQNANLIPTFQALVDGEVKITREPRYSDIPGEFMQPTAFAVNPKSKHIKESIELINWLVNDVDGNLIFKADYGTPGDPDVLQAIKDQATEEQKKNYGFVEVLLNDDKLPSNNARAEGSSSVLDVLLRSVYEDISSESTNMASGIDKFFNEASAILSKNP